MNRLFSKEDYDASKSWGILTSIDLFNCNPETLRDAEKIKEYIIELCELIDMKRFGEPIIVRFGTDPRVQGYSAMQLIETSCISGHFAEESNSVYIDIFSCKFYNQNDAIEFTQKFFDAKDVESNIVLRGKGIVKN
ncbi:S-adenosylmethionine decarboxylase [Candidatus Pacearchaeota archaeon]|nr:S-adenosylmethionine decarboxylase [Candidatus Pacearchaeota archaeon]